MPSVTAASYGKDNVRLLTTHRDPETGVHTVAETTVRVLLEGAIESSYTHADNSVIVATDSIKNAVFVLARQQQQQSATANAPPELFAVTVGAHLLARYRHIRTAHIRLRVRRWVRMTVDGAPHPHSFVQEGEEKRTVEARVDGNSSSGDDDDKDGDRIQISLCSGITDLSVLKTTGSAFHGFIRDDLTTLPETWDRILSTDVCAAWHWAPFADLDAVRRAADAGMFDDAHNAARRITLRRFALDESASVQATMYKMAEDILEAVPGVAKVDYSLPNNHYFELDLSWHNGIKNTGKDAQVYVPQSNPNGIIQVQVSRDEPSS